MNDIRVSNWADLTEILYAASWKHELGRFRSDFAFRGLAAPDAELLTGLMRLGEGAAELEGHLLRNFRKYASSDAVPHDSVWNWLALAQHHGLPTRMLDWTYSPLVALHFVTQNMELYDRDGIIWCVDYVQTNARLPAVLKDILARECASVFTADMLDEAAESLSRFGLLAGNGEPFVVFLEPPSLDERIVNQFALFSLMSNPTSRLDEWLAAHPDLFDRLIIPKELKWEVRDKLDQANVTERVLFPGLDGLSSWLKRYYTARSVT